MRYRRLDADGDYSFGNGGKDFLVDSPEAIAQAVRTRLGLIEGEWFLDVTEGTPYETQILGTHSQTTRDIAIRDRILGTTGVKEIIAYSSEVLGRAFSVTVAISTIYGATTITQVF